MGEHTEHIGDRVRRAREAAGMSQSDIAVSAGMTQQAIGAIESGRVLRPKKLRETARALRVSEGFLLGEQEISPPTALAATGRAVSEPTADMVSEVVASFLRMNPQSQEAVWRLVNTLAKQDELLRRAQQERKD